MPGYRCSKNEHASNPERCFSSHLVGIWNSAGDWRESCECTQQHSIVSHHQNKCCTMDGTGGWHERAGHYKNAKFCDWIKVHVNASQYNGFHEILQWQGTMQKFPFLHSFAQEHDRDILFPNSEPVWDNDIMLGNCVSISTRGVSNMCKAQNICCKSWSSWAFSDMDALQHITEDIVLPSVL